MASCWLQPLDGCNQQAYLGGALKSSLNYFLKKTNKQLCLLFDLRILFWTDWDATFPRIEAASMSGVGRHIVFKDMESGAWPNGLTLDHQEKRIVWTDARYGF